MVEILPPSDAAIAAAADLLRAGELVAFATETVYGLGADGGNDAAVARLYAAKGRPRFNPLIAHLPDSDAVWRHGEANPLATALAARFWPGPLTLVMAHRGDGGISPLARAGLETCALRVPASATARALLTAAGRPVVAPSANPSEGISPTRADHVAAGLGDRVALIIDDGPCPIGVESTVIDVTGPAPRLLRPGAITAAMIAETLGMPESSLHGDKGGGAVRAPGMLRRHYAPGKPLRLNAVAPRPGEAYLGWGALPAHDGPAISLSLTADIAEAAANLFAMLHRLDAGAGSAIAVAPIPESGLGAAINDRLRRAAQPRDEMSNAGG